MTVEYPDDAIDGFPSPPRTVTDKTGREIEYRQAQDDAENLVEMYLQFSPEDRAQGIPPTNEEDIKEWIDIVTTEEGLNVIASHDDDAVGHVMLVADPEETYELAIFVLQEYQGAGIGTELVRTALGQAQESGIEYIWLSVERWNSPAVALYKKIGFEPTGDDRFEKMMALRVA